MTGEPYGTTATGHRCVNAEPGTFGHECGRPARWVGTHRNGWRACYCDDCRTNGSEAATATDWQPIRTENGNA